MDYPLEKNYIEATSVSNSLCGDGRKSSPWKPENFTAETDETERTDVTAQSNRNIIAYYAIIMPSVTASET